MRSNATVRFRVTVNLLQKFVVLGRNLSWGGPMQNCKATLSDMQQFCGVAKFILLLNHQCNNSLANIECVQCLVSQRE